MTNLRSQNKGLTGCPKKSERVASYLACRKWLVVSPKSRGGWLAGLRVEGNYINLQWDCDLGCGSLSHVGLGWDQRGWVC